MEKVALQSDSRREDRAARRGAAERILCLAQHLAPQDAFLLRQVYECGLKIRDIALQAGLTRHQVHWRLRAALRRLRSPFFAFVVAHGDLLSPTVRRTAELVICQGVTQLQAARRTCRSLHAIRQDLHTVRALARF